MKYTCYHWNMVYVCYYVRATCYHVVTMSVTMSSHVLSTCYHV